MTRYLRPSVNGGISECRSPEEKVGYGRCHHVLGEQEVVVNYNKQEKSHYVNVQREVVGEEGIRAAEKEVREFVSGLRSSGAVDEARAVQIMESIK